MEDRGEVAVRGLDQIGTPGKVTGPVPVRMGLRIEASRPAPLLPAVLTDANARAVPEAMELEVRADEAGWAQLGPALALVGRITLECPAILVLPQDRQEAAV